jgi:hypothetical protein
LACARLEIVAGSSEGEDVSRAVVEDHGSATTGIFVGDFREVFGEELFDDAVESEVKGGADFATLWSEASSSLEEEINKVRCGKGSSCGLELEWFLGGASEGIGVDGAIGGHASEHP